MILALDTCCVCGIEFGMPQRFFETRRSEGKSFYCPNGHCLMFGETTADKLRREVDRLKQQQARVEGERDAAQRERDNAQRSLVATRGQMKRLRDRVEKGVCPDCNRTFANLARHMACKHGTPRKAEAVTPDGSKVVPIRRTRHA